MRPSGTTETLTYLADDAVFQLVRYLHISSGTFKPTDTRMVRPKPLSRIYNQANAPPVVAFLTQLLTCSGLEGALVSTNIHSNECQ